MGRKPGPSGKTTPRCGQSRRPGTHGSPRRIEYRNHHLVQRFVLLYTLDLIGVAVFSMSGALAAGRKRLDLLGVCVLGLVTAVGGGTIRDVLLARHPIFWLADSAYIIVIIASALVTVAYVRWRPPPAATLLYADAIGLAMFSVTGAQIAERAGLPPLAGIVLGTVTGSAGGVVRDILSAEIPLVLRRGNLYASAAISGTARLLHPRHARRGARTGHLGRHDRRGVGPRRVDRLGPQASGLRSGRRECFRRHGSNV